MKRLKVRINIPTRTTQYTINNLTRSKSQNNLNPINLYSLVHNTKNKRINASRNCESMICYGQAVERWDKVYCKRVIFKKRLSIVRKSNRDCMKSIFDIMVKKIR